MLLKKRKRALRPDSFDDSDIFLNILILIITSLAIHYSQNGFRGFFFFFILLCIEVQVIFRGFFKFYSSSARDPPSRSPLAYLRLTEKR